jgi:hypothetical protein
MIRNILSILLGYAFFVATSLVFFKISGRDPHAEPTILFVILTIMYGVVFSFLAGLVTRLISNTTELKLNYILACIIAGFATFSFFKSEGNHWTQLLAIFIFAPASILGVLFYSKQKRKKRTT